MVFACMEKKRKKKKNRREREFWKKKERGCLEREIERREMREYTCDEDLEGTASKAVRFPMRACRFLPLPPPPLLSTPVSHLILPFCLFPRKIFSFLCSPLHQK